MYIGNKVHPIEDLWYTVEPLLQMFLVVSLELSQSFILNRIVEMGGRVNV